MTRRRCECEYEEDNCEMGCQRWLRDTHVPIGETQGVYNPNIPFIVERSYFPSTYGMQPLRPVPIGPHTMAGETYPCRIGKCKTKKKAKRK